MKSGFLCYAHFINSFTKKELPKNKGGLHNREVAKVGALLLKNKKMRKNIEDLIIENSIEGITKKDAVGGVIAILLIWAFLFLLGFIQ